MAHLKLFVLGQPRLESDGKPIELNLRKALALLVYLAVSSRPHSREALATLFWPESDGREGRARLRRTLHRLNEALGMRALAGARTTEDESQLRIRQVGPNRQGPHRASGCVEARTAHPQ